MQITKLKKFTKDPLMDKLSIDARSLLFDFLPYLINGEGRLISGSNPITVTNFTDYSRGEWHYQNPFTELINNGLLREDGSIYYCPLLMSVKKRNSRYEKYPQLLSEYVLNQNDPHHIKLAKYIHTVLYKKHPDNLNIKKANTEKWAEECRLMRDTDQRKYGHIYNVFKFAMADIEFWSNVVQSPGGLRKNFDTIVGKMKGGSKGTDYAPDTIKSTEYLKVDD